MQVHLYTLCWNEADMLPFFFRHYDPFVDRYVIYDDGSSDGSLDILRGHPKVETRRFERTHADSFVLSHRDMHNEVWKESRGKADWVIITALDEHLQAKGWSNRAYLAACARAGFTMMPAVGFQMVSEDLPAEGERLASIRTLGAYWDAMNKLSIFNPDAMRETNFKVGRHEVAPVGELRLPPRDEIMLLHYKYLGLTRTFERHLVQSVGLGPMDRAKGWGEQYSWSLKQFKESWDKFRTRAIDVGDPGFVPWRTPELQRWWRPQEFVDKEPGFLQRCGIRTRWTPM